MLKVNIKFFILTLAAFIFAFESGGRLPYAIFYCFLIVLLLGFIQVIIEKTFINVEVISEKEVYSTRDTEVIYTIVKPGNVIHSFYYVVTNDILSTFIKGYEGNTIFQGFDNEKSTVNEVEFTLRGIYDFGNINLTFSDLFCIFKACKKLYSGKIIKVYPQIYKLMNCRFEGKSIIEDFLQNISVSEDSNDVRDLRRYREGDSFRRIHWKVSAKHNELYVKNFNAVTAVNAGLFINMEKPNLLMESAENLEEKMVDFSASVIKLLVDKNIKARTYIYNKEEKIIDTGDKLSFNQLMEYFLTNKSKGDEFFSEFIRAKLGQMKEGCFIGIITLRVDNSLKTMIYTLAKMGFKINIFYLIEDKNAQRKDDLLDVDFINIDKMLR